MFYLNSCIPEYFESASGDCVACICNSDGSISNTCDFSGQCTCKTGYEGVSCGECQQGYISLASGVCEACPCPGSGNNFATSCNQVSGSTVCECNTGYEGDRCESCSPDYHYQFTGTPILL